MEAAIENGRQFGNTESRDFTRSHIATSGVTYRSNVAPQTQTKITEYPCSVSSPTSLASVPQDR